MFTWIMHPQIKIIIRILLYEPKCSNESELIYYLTQIDCVFQLNLSKTSVLIHIHNKFYYHPKKKYCISYKVINNISFLFPGASFKLMIVICRLVRIHFNMHLIHIKQSVKFELINLIHFCWPKPPNFYRYL